MTNFFFLFLKKNSSAAKCFEFLNNRWRLEIGGKFDRSTHGDMNLMV